MQAMLGMRLSRQWVPTKEVDGKECVPSTEFVRGGDSNFDWNPDQDHVCKALMALQTMLLQTERDRIPLAGLAQRLGCRVEAARAEEHDSLRVSIVAGS